MSVTDKDIFDKFRQMAGGSLTQEQVDGLNAVIQAGQRHYFRRERHAKLERQFKPRIP